MGYFLLTEIIESDLFNLRLSMCRKTGFTRQEFNIAHEHVYVRSRYLSVVHQRLKFQTKR
jgi:hypothetical protein